MTQRISRRCRRGAVAFGRALLRRARTQADAGMTTVEYAVGTLVAAALAAVLYQIVTGESVLTGLTNLVNRALAVV